MTEPEPFSTDARRSSRDLELVRVALERTLPDHIADGSDFHVGDLAGTSATGMSSETLLFEATWTGAAGPKQADLVARVAPDEQDVPVFPVYDLPGQYNTISTVGSLTDVPVPTPWWCEPDPAVIGSPFFVMGRVEGEVPPDIMPYNFGESWLFKGSRSEQQKLQDSTVSVLARLHAIDDPEKQFAHLVGDFPGETALRRHVAGRRAWYEWAARDCGRSSLVEKAFAWLDENFPADEGPAVFNWGDSRIGNVLYRNFEPAAVLDWEMAGLGPRELDLAWLAYMHSMFDDMAVQYGFPGMPHFLELDDVAATYEKMTGHTPRHLEWYGTYSCLQLSIVYLRTGQRSVHFGEREAPSDADDLLMNGPALAARIGV